MTITGDFKAFADDAGAFCRNWGVIRKVIKELEGLAEYGLKINKRKCEILVKKLPNLAIDNSIDSEDDDPDPSNMPRKRPIEKRKNIIRQEN